MSTTTGTSAPARLTGGPTGTLAGAVAAEWTKLWTVRSTLACLLAAAGLGTLYPLITSVTVRSQHAAGLADPLTIPPAAAAGSGILILGQLALLTLATLTIAGEYATGSIRTTLQCTPGRQQLLLAKCLVLAPVLAAAGVVLTVTGTALGWLVMGELTPAPAAGDVVRMAAGAGAYLALAGALIVAIGAVVRSVAGTITAALVLVLLAPMILDQSGNDVLGWVAAALPGSAGRVLIVGEGTGPYGPGAALAVALAWAVAGQVAAGALMRRRDR